MQNWLLQFFQEESILDSRPLPKAGSERRYTRIRTDKGSYILCEGSSEADYKSFIYLTLHFSKYNLPVPLLLATHEESRSYVLSDGGKIDLLHEVQTHGHTEPVKDLYKKCLHQLVRLQVDAGSTLDPLQCSVQHPFNAHFIQADLNYFKYYFLDRFSISYDRMSWHNEVEQFSERVAQSQPVGFMYRDFQGRNILIQENEPVFIDYQGGMQGPIAYDVASLLWQAKAQLPVAWKQELLQYYTEALQQYLPNTSTDLQAGYGNLVLVRLLQVLGAYGLRGIIEKKSHFISSIPYGLENIETWLSLYSGTGLPTLDAVLKQLAAPEFRQQFHPPITSSSGSTFKVLVQSFSFKKGLPPDETGNGGGYIFDCRGLLNPGRFEEYKKLTGRDQPVIDFLEQKTKTPEFLNHVKSVLAISIEDYLARGFENLQISFGCTGGQHRSVYCADQIARYIQETYGVQPMVRHVVQDAKNWVND